MGNWTVKRRVTRKPKTIVFFFSSSNKIVNGKYSILKSMKNNSVFDNDKETKVKKKIFKNIEIYKKNCCRQ